VFSDLSSSTAALERQLAEQNCIEYQPPSQRDEETPALEVDEIDPTIHTNVNVDGTDGWLEDLTVSWDDQLFDFPGPETSASEASTIPPVPEGLILSDMVRADL
jgi:hypothetical protein